MLRFSIVEVSFGPLWVMLSFPIVVVSWDPTDLFEKVIIFPQPRGPQLILLRKCWFFMSMRRTPVTKDILYDHHCLLSHQLWLKVKWLSLRLLLHLWQQVLFTFTHLLQECQWVKEECDASKVFCSCKYVFETLCNTLACMEIGGALKSKYEQNLNKKRNLFFFNFNSAPRWKCIWGAADENQSKSVGRRDLVQARKNFHQLRFILWRIVFYTQAAAAT